MDKSCTNGYCSYRYMGGGTTGWGCSYIGYCDFQRPRDSRPLCIPNSETEAKPKED
jgi:hypothetical protein